MPNNSTYVYLRSLNVPLNWRVISRSLLWLLICCVVPCCRADSTVVFNEIMYHPATNEAALEWVELYNQNAVDMDLSGWSLSVGYTFPSGTILNGGKYLVVASSPETLAANGFSGAYGPFTNRLSNGGEKLELRNNSGRLVDWVDYGTEDDWPIGPDGGGVSLAKLKPNQTSREAANWASSAQIGGTPGAANLFSPASSTQFSEITAASATPFWIELSNSTDATISLDGFRITSQGSVDVTYTFPPNSALGSKAFLLLDQETLGFRPKSGDKLIFYSAGGALLDAIVVKKSLRARDADGRWLFPSEETPGAPNVFQLNNAIVINEIMYQPRPILSPGGTNTAKWIELFNRGSKTVDLSGWSFSKGIQFAFRPGTILNPGEYLVVAQDTNLMHSLYRDIQLTGNFSNNLSGSSDRLVLVDLNKNPVNQVRYFDDYPWPWQAGGFGSSIELRDPRSDNSKPEAWAASNDGARAQWNTYTYTAVAKSDGGPTRWNEFVMGLLDAGEILIDDLTVIEDPDVANKQLLQNGSFENGQTSWRFLGTHRKSHVIVDPDNPANHVLDLIATGATEHMHNHVETTYLGNVPIGNGKKYKITYRAKWVGGSAKLNTRLYFNRVAKTTTLDLPSDGGTPGKQNSAYAANIGPTVDKFIHSPVVPTTAQSVTVTAHVSDPDGVKSCTLWSADNGVTWTSTPMALNSGGEYVAAITPKGSSTTVQFYIEAEDSLGAKSVYPPGGRESRALYRANDGQAKAGSRIHQLRILMLPSDAAQLHAVTNVMGNDYMPSTFLYDEQEPVYNTGVHMQGSERGRFDVSRAGFTLKFPADHLFRGVHNGITFDRSGGYSGQGGKQDEIIIRHIANAAGGGLPDMYNDLATVIAPQAAYTSTAMLMMSKYNEEFLDTAFPNGADGSNFKIELIYYPTSSVGNDPQKPKLPQPDDVIGTDFQNLGTDPEPYRWFFLAENHSDRNDYSGLITLAKAFGSTGATLEQKMRDLIDPDQWTRVFALKSLSGDADTYGWGYTHNQMFYIAPTGRAYTFPWDEDFSWARPSTDSINMGAQAGSMINGSFAFHRLYYGHLLDIINKSYNTNYMARWTSHYGSLVGQNYSPILSYIGQRAKSAKSQLPASTPFVITTNNGQDFTTNTATVKLTGRAWIDVKSIKLENATDPLPITWTAINAWQVTLPLQSAQTRFGFVPLNFDGREMGTNYITVTSTALNLDADGDGMPDDWENRYGLNPRLNDANDDLDRDGFTNLQEYRAGTDPSDPLSRLALTAQQVAPSQFKLSFQTKSAKAYRLEYRIGLANSWQLLTSVPAAAQDGTFQVVQTISPLANAIFYRVVLGP
jgi:hypothetical protein